MLVSDGVGGANAGEVASQMAAKGIPDELGKAQPVFADLKSARESIERSVRKANGEITMKSKEAGFEGMGATLSLVCFCTGGAAVWMQAGDSRIYVFRRGQLRQISRDHSPVGRMRHEGKISEEEARVHPLRNQIDQSLGDPMKLFEPETGEEPVVAGDVFLVCSDGISDGLWDRQIAEVLSSVKSKVSVRPAVEKLVSSAKAASGRDNLTAVLGYVGHGKRSLLGMLRNK